MHSLEKDLARTSVEKSGREGTRTPDQWPSGERALKLSQHQIDELDLNAKRLQMIFFRRDPLLKKESIIEWIEKSNTYSISEMLPNFRRLQNKIISIYVNLCDVVHLLKVAAKLRHNLIKPVFSNSKICRKREFVLIYSSYMENKRNNVLLKRRGRASQCSEVSQVFY